MKFGFTMHDGELVEIKNISTQFEINNSLDYSNNKLKDTNVLFFNGEIMKEITFESIIPNYEKELFPTYNNLWNKNTEDIQPVIVFYNLFNESGGGNYLESSPNYYWTDFSLKDDLEDGLTITWTFVEFRQFKIQKKNFNIWSKPQAKKAAKPKGKVTKRSKVNANNNTKLLLGKCGNMSRNSSRGVKCVKYLQQFLKDGGYYKNCKIDGQFGYYTVVNLKKAQKRWGLPQTGKWDDLTRVAYIIRYNYPAKIYKGLVNGTITDLKLLAAYQQFQKIKRNKKKNKKKKKTTKKKK